MQSIDISQFDSQADMPVTRAKLEAFAKLLPNEYRFIKDVFVLKKQGMKHTVQQLYDLYETYCQGNEKKAITKYDFTAKLREIELDFKHTKINGYYYYRYSYEHLQSIADKFHWIHELDAESDEEEQRLSTAVKDEGPIRQKIDFNIILKSENDQLKKEIELLKQQIKQLISPQKVVKKVIKKVKKEHEPEPEQVDDPSPALRVTREIRDQDMKIRMFV
jgi:hypothetical protein